MVPYKHVLVASHQRSGTHLTIDTLRANFEQLADDYINVDQMLPTHMLFLSPDDLRGLLESEKKKPIIKSHATPALADFAYDDVALEMARKVKEESKIVYVYRDGRDVLSSLYHFEKSRTPKPPERTFSEFLRSPSLDVPAGWPVDTTPLEGWARHVSEWLDAGNCLSISYEELRTDPDAGLRKLADYLDVPAPPTVKPVKFHRPSIVARAIRRLTGRQFTSSAVKPRRGIIGDWVNHFSRDDEALFWDRAGPVMRRLGYG